MSFDSQAGHEQTKRRPALVVSPGAFNTAFGLAYVMPITSKARGHAFEVPLPETCAVRGVVMTQQTIT
jgi:mRNA interferase MazF